MTDPNSISGVVAAAVAAPDSDITGILALLIPIVAIAMAMGAGMLKIWLDYRKKREFFQLHHAERMAAIDKGVEVPPLPPEFFNEPRSRSRGPHDQLRGGLLWLLVGAAITVALWSNDREAALWGLVPVAFGVSKLLFYWLAPRMPNEGAPPPKP